jgi:ABC-type antimicrobial peptide transport system permease subunit
MALGANGPSVVRLVVGHALRATFAGTAIGLVAFLAASKLLRAQLYEVRATDPAVLAAAAVTLLGAALLAAWLPARHAARVDPMTALRIE